MAERGQDRKAPQWVGVRKLRENLTGFLRQVRHGRSFLVTSRDQVLVELRPAAKLDQPRRKPGALRGEIWTAPDFDTFPPDVLASMEGEED